jgi:hypothetical protein
VKLPEADAMRQALAMVLGTSVDEYCPNCARPLHEDDGLPPHDVEECGKEIEKLSAMLDEGITVSFNDGGPDEVWDHTNTTLT